MSSKLQFRAQILENLNKIEFEKMMNISYQKEQQEIVAWFFNFEDKDFLQQVLLKELNSEKIDTFDKIGFLLSEIGNIDTLKEPLWNYIKDPKTSDKTKQISCSILRMLGETVHPNDILTYFHNPQEVIDIETQKLLDVALFNPEVQIDFLDFLFALPQQEQTTLISSLENEYQGDSLINVLIPILDATENEDTQEFIIKTLGNSKSTNALDPLKNIELYSKNEKLKKLAQIGLKKLRLAGIYERSNFAKEEDEQKIYESYVSQIDGMGNQGIVLTKRDENIVQMCTITISDTQGLLDCFGFYMLTPNEFEQILNNFQKNSPAIKMPPSFVKNLLTNAETLSRKLSKPIPYEYSAWKTLFSNIEIKKTNYKELATEYVQSLKKANYSLLLDNDIFSTWFFEKEDNENCDNLFKEILHENFVVNEKLETLITEYIPQIFDKNLMKLYKNRLYNTMFLQNTIKEIAIRDNVAFIALQLEILENPLECELFRWIIKKSIYELFLKEKSSFENQFTVETNIFAKNKEKYQSVFTKNQVETIINDLLKQWGQ